MQPFSEILFEKYCQARGYEQQKLAEGTQRTPDYEVSTPHGVFISEVTQLEQNNDDKSWFEQVIQNGGSWSSSRPVAELSKKIRNRLIKKFERKQLELYAKQGLPTLLVLFDTTGRFYLNKFTLDGAMYGDQQAWVSRNRDEAAIFEHGGNRQFREDKGTYISAVAILHSTPSLEIFYNYYADVPFPAELLTNPADKHWKHSENPHA